jgi:hypothetical protein
MKKIILGLFGIMAIVVLMVFNTQFITNSNSDSYTLFSLVMQTNANAESGDCVDSPNCSSISDCDVSKGQSKSSGKLVCCTLAPYMGKKCQFVEM